MTLNLTLITPSGAWQCADHRLTDPRSGRPIDDYTHKHLSLRCPDGSALITFAGAGRVGDIDVVQWLREVLRGESGTVDQSLIHLRNAATRDLGPIVGGRLPHMFSVAAFLGGRPWIAQIRNFKGVDGQPSGPFLREFETIAKHLERGGHAWSIYGAYDAVSAKDVALLIHASQRRPRLPDDYHGLLAAVNRRTAHSSLSRGTVSPHCTTHFVPPTGDPFSTKFHAEGSARGLRTTAPMLLFGIDVGELMDAAFQTFEQQGTPPLSDAFAEAGQRSVRTGNPLRPK